MLTFFRRIRKGLLDGGRTSKYLLYAIGEIALVVIGILIALQINNWNEWRKNRKKEILVLTEISATLAENLEVLDSLLVQLEEALTSGKIVISALEDNKAYSDSLDRHFFKASWLEVTRISGGLSTEGYEYLKNQGFDLIRNHELRKKIISLFEKSIGVYTSGTMDYQSKANYSINRLRELFYATDVGKSLDVAWKPFDYNRLLEDNYYYSLVNGFQAFRKIHYERTLNLRNQTNFLFQLISDASLE